TTGETLATVPVPYDVAAGGAILSGATRQRQLAFTLPQGRRGAGQIEVVVTTDSASQVVEVNATGAGESNNSARQTLDSALAPYPDLQVTNLRIDPTSGLQSG